MKESDDDHWVKPGNLFRLTSSAQQDALFENTARQIGGASLSVQQRHVANCTRADSTYRAEVTRALGLEFDLQSPATAN